MLVIDVGYSGVVNAHRQYVFLLRILCKVAITMKVKITHEFLNETVYLCFNCEKNRCKQSQKKRKEKDLI